jgi:hypothetical protein
MQQKEAGPSTSNTHAHFAKSPPHRAPSAAGSKRSSLIMDEGNYTLMTLTLLQQHGCRSPSSLLAERTGRAFVRRASGVDLGSSRVRTKRARVFNGPVARSHVRGASSSCSKDLICGARPERPRVCGNRGRPARSFPVWLWYFDTSSGSRGGDGGFAGRIFDRRANGTHR